MIVKKKLKIKSVLILFGIIILIAGGIYLFLNLHIKNIYVIGNHYLEEKDILDKTNLLEYPKIVSVSTNDLEKSIASLDLVKSVKVKKSLFGKIQIIIEEYQPLYYNLDKKIVLSSGNILEYNASMILPYQKNKIDDSVQEKFNQAFVEVSQDILIHISEIEYSPSSLDKERFLFYMNDGNYVYVTLSKISLINTYNEVYPTLDGKKGILYLDSGNHFEIKEKNND